MLWSLLIISLIGSAHNDGSANTEYLIQNGITSQSSTYKYHHTSQKAVDGKKNLCTDIVAEQQSDPWWTIDLLDVYNVSRIIIYNKCQNNTDMTGAQIYVGNSRDVNNSIVNEKFKNITDFDLGKWNHFKLNGHAVGRYITVSLPRRVPLTLCEVKIYGKIKESPFVLIKENKTWPDALYYCRDHYMNLASILNEDAQTWAEVEARKASSPFVWLGLHYTCTLDFWFWVEDHRLDFNRWAPGSKTEACDMSSAMETRVEHQWFSKSDYEEFNFICVKATSSGACPGV